MHTKTRATWHPSAQPPYPLPPYAAETGRAPRAPRRSRVPSIVGAAAAIALMGGALLAVIASADSREMRDAQCTAALAAAQTISANSRYNWEQAITLTQVGAMSQYADQRDDAERMLRKTEDAIHAREVLLEAAQARFNTALKGCNA